MKKQIIIYSISSIVILFIVEQVLKMPYLVKTAVKVPMFLIIPLLFYKYKLKQKLIIRMHKAELKYIITWSAIVFVAIFLVYFMIQSFIDIEAIGSDFTNRMAISHQMMLFAGAYSIIINSFIEEIFFRGFIFQSLLKLGWNKRAYIYSALLFALYHVAIFRTWFNFGMMGLMLVGLFVGGIIFAYFVKRTESFLAAWLIHMTADLAIIAIGLRMLKVI